MKKADVKVKSKPAENVKVAGEFAGPAPVIEESKVPENFFDESVLSTSKHAPKSNSFCVCLTGRPKLVEVDTIALFDAQLRKESEEDAEAEAEVVFSAQQAVLEDMCVTELGCIYASRQSNETFENLRDRVSKKARIHGSQSIVRFFRVIP
jgi:hypothetical protein